MYRNNLRLSTVKGKSINYEMIIKLKNFFRLTGKKKQFIR